jgi:phosphatidylserine decarboxylase
LSKVVALAYAAAYRVNMEEAHVEGPFPSFDAFFTRRLRYGVRAISEEPIVSPADGRLSASGAVSQGCRIQVKGQDYLVSELIGSSEDAKRYVGGSFAVVYLSPRDYHRVHSPVAGHLLSVRAIPGDLFPVNSIGERYVRDLFVRNNRVAFSIASESVGAVTLVMVGATIVGRIGVSALDDASPPPGLTRLDPTVALQRGDEVGIFHLGSTVVVLFEPGVPPLRQLGSVRYGETLLREV